VDPEVTREIFLEAATLLDNGLVLDGLDAHDATAVVAGLCVDLLAEDPGAAIRARSQTISDGSNGSDSSQDLHDPASVSRAYLIAAAVFKL
jgi:hypothetical protein